MSMILAGDVGGTKTLLGIFESQSARLRSVAVRSFATNEHADLGSVIAAFFKVQDTDAAQVDHACFGIAGPIVGTTARLTNAPFEIDSTRLTSRFGFRATLLNDLEAMAYAVPALDETQVRVLQEGEAVDGGNLALIAAGTGLGESLLHNVNGRLVAVATEGGHADWAARTERDIKVLRELTQRFGRVEIEQVVSGMGLVNLHPIAHTAACVVLKDLEDPDAAARISSAALARKCPGCTEALDIFVEAYGAEAGNLALRTLATGGVFIGGGIAPKILPALEKPLFMNAFRSKAPFHTLLSRIPVKVILEPDAGLLGAAIYAADIARRT